MTFFTRPRGRAAKPSRFPPPPPARGAGRRRIPGSRAPRRDPRRPSGTRRGAARPSSRPTIPAARPPRPGGRADGERGASGRQPRGRRNATGLFHGPGMVPRRPGVVPHGGRLRDGQGSQAHQPLLAVASRASHHPGTTAGPALHLARALAALARLALDLAVALAGGALLRPVLA